MAIASDLLDGRLARRPGAPTAFGGLAAGRSVDFPRPSPVRYLSAGLQGLIAVRAIRRSPV